MENTIADKKINKIDENSFDTVTGGVGGSPVPRDIRDYAWKDNPEKWEEYYGMLRKPLEYDKRDD